MGLTISLATTARAQTQATTLPLMLPSATVFDAQGNLYFAETGNHVVRKLSSGGIITTVAGNGVQGFSGDNGPATAAELTRPPDLRWTRLAISISPTATTTAFARLQPQRASSRPLRARA